MSKTHELFAFLRYYLKLRLRVALGRHDTDRSLNLGYRWRHWQRNYRPRLF